MAYMIRNSRNNKRRVINKEINEQGRTKKKKSASSGNGFYYSFLTIILLFCLVQITISAVLNVSKIISYKAKIVQITKTRDAALSLNDQLKDNINNYSNITGMEAIARNNLKMSGEDEVLVIINTPKQEEKVEKPEKFKFFHHTKQD